MSGTVYKRCTRCGNRVKERTCGKCGLTGRFNWAFRAYVGKDADGRWLRRLRGGFPTKKDAERALRELLSSVEDGGFVATSTMTLAEFLRDEWLPATAPPRVKYETWSDRKRNLEDHVVPRVGGVALGDLNAAHFNRLYADLLRDGRIHQPGGLSPTSVRRIHAMIRKALNDAVRWGMLTRNAALLADPPPMRVVKASRRRGMQTWSPSELRDFLGSTREHELHTLWCVLAATGMRRSEILGLRWSEVDLAAGTLTVRQTILATADSFQPQDDQKSEGSARTIHLDSRTVAQLRAPGRAERGEARARVCMAGQQSRVPAPGRQMVEPAGNLPGLPPRRQARRRDAHQAAGRQAHAHLAAAGCRHQPEGRVRAARTQLGRLHAGHVRPCHARHATGGRRALHGARPRPRSRR
ncbi:MAG: Arm DNA-binding domain-containing protein [Euzebyales bacterium]|nr:Arm DNA-binding domain-containing protein [Euzebyales bacterium]